MKHLTCILGLGLFASPAFAQTNHSVDFARDVLPIFRQNCISCHGPDVANSGLRLDRKSSVFKDGTRRLVPGSLENSFLYHRVTGNDFGMQMPPTGPLRPEQIATIKAWIEQGADWPDSLSSEAERAPLNPKAISAIDSLRTGDSKAFLKALAEDPTLINARGPEGSTPLMYAALYGDAALLEQLLNTTANPNLKNDAGATALMWAASSLAKTRLLIDHGADVNAISEDLRTPLMIAAGLPAGRPVVTLLLEHGANVNPTKHPDAESSPLTQATLAADPETIRLLLDHGADAKASGISALPIALDQNCPKCFDILMKQPFDKNVYTATLQSVANFADAATVRALLDHGADPDAADPLGHTPLAYAAGSDNNPGDVVKLLMDRGATINSRSPHKNSVDTGMSVLDIARLRGQTPVVSLLLKAGATSAVPAAPAPKPQPAASASEAIKRSLPLLQRADASFTAKAGCVSCHNDSLASMTVGLARKHGFAVDEPISRQQVKATLASLEHQRNLLHQGVAGGGPFFDTITPHILGYVLIGLNSEGHPADLDTDAAAMYIKSRQMPDGSWPYPEADPRPPLCSDHIGQTTLALRALQLYPPQAFKADYETAVSNAAAWLAKSQARTTEDYLWKLMGLAWAGRDKSATAKTRRDLLALQRPDGGWADLPSLPSNPYATGKALYALNLAGLAPTDPAWKRATAYLLKTQMADGSWYVPTRALGFQPYFETGFPHGVNQSLSAAGTSWATMALILGGS